MSLFYYIDPLSKYMSRYVTGVDNMRQYHESTEKRALLVDLKLQKWLVMV